MPESRLRAYGQFLVALFYYFLARALARRGAMGLAGEQWSPLIEQMMLVFLLLLGYAGLGFALNRQEHPIGTQGLPRRPGWTREVGLGLAVGWAAAAICVLVLAVFGGIAIGLSFSLSAWGWLLVNAGYFALLCLGEEIAFRGYPFQRFVRATGSAGAVLAFALLYAFLQSMIPGSTRASAAVSFVLGVVLSAAYLRTRALWVSWGINFGWKASRALIFGLAVSGDNSHSSVVLGDPTGSFWLTGGGFGLEDSWFTMLVLLAALPVVYRLTRDLDFRYNTPEIVAAGIPVDLDAAARRQHEAAMGQAEPAAPPLVQIVPQSAPPEAPAPENPQQPPPNAGNESL
ncbi:MAG TPA: type II CAAX endopeptidase family protein [Terracidiphilus sp.]|jgi:hypothetical protein|nr:type II CAAX endopeptidase family protein [Terracidiphilus sp.]